MNARRTSIIILVLLLAGLTIPVRAESAPKAVAEGNKLYLEENYEDASMQYDKAAELKPNSFEPKFNKANALYRLGEIEKAIDLYKEVAARSTNKELIKRAKYNLGNSHFQKGIKAQAQAQVGQMAQMTPQGDAQQQPQESADPVEEYKSAIKSWRQVLDMDKSNDKVKNNLEVAKKTLQKLKEQQKQQQQQQKQDGENSEDEEKKKQENDDKSSDQKDDQQKQDQDQGEKQDQQNQDEQKQDDQESEQQQQDQQQVKQEDAPDATADEILKKEKEDKKARQIIRLRQVPVEKDW